MSRSVDQLIDLLMLPAWGRWARPRIERELGYKPPGWSKLVKQEYPPDSPRGGEAVIDDDYAELLDSKITKLKGYQKPVLMLLYVAQISCRQAAKELKISRIELMQQRDAAVWYLCGRLAEEVAEMEEEMDDAYLEKRA